MLAATRTNFRELFMLRKPATNDNLTQAILTALRVQTVLNNWDPNSVFHQSNISKAQRDIDLLANIIIPEYITRANRTNMKQIECMKRLQLVPQQLRNNFSKMGKIFKIY